MAWACFAVIVAYLVGSILMKKNRVAMTIIDSIAIIMIVMVMLKGLKVL